MSSIRLAAFAVATCSSQVFAGLVGGPAQISLMQVGRGHADAPDFFSKAINTVTIADPPVGSFLRLGGGIPAVERFLSILTFESTATISTGYLANFSFRSEVETAPAASTAHDFSFAGNRLGFTALEEGDLTLAGQTQGSGSGSLFFLDYADPTTLHIIPIVSDSFLVSISFSAGDRMFAWGVLNDPAGGMADWEGVASVFVVPAPGAAALLALAGLLVGRRRRR